MPGGRAGGGGGHASGGGGGRVGGSFGGSRSSGSSFGGYRAGGGSRGSFYPSVGSRPVRDYTPRSSQRYNVPSSMRPSYRTSRPIIYAGPIYHSSGHSGSSSSKPGTAAHAGGASGGSSSSSGNSGCATLLIVFLVFGLILLLFGALAGRGGSSSGGVTASTVQREPLAASAVKETGYYEDNIGMINSSSALQAGMKQFYQETGVQPFLYTTPDVNGDYDPSNTTLEAYAQTLYSELFDDDGHFLVIIYDADPSGFGYYYIPGNAAKAVMDAEALSIFEGYVNADFDQYYDSPAGYFSNVFSDTSSRIMQVTKSPLIKVGMVIILVAGIALLYLWWKKAKEKKIEEMEKAQQILDADIGELIKDPELEALEQKYGDKKDQ